MVDRHVPQCGHMDIYLALTNTAISNDLKLVFMMFYDANDHHHLYHNHYCHHIDDQEYERAVIFRLGRLLTGGARGPGHRQHRHRHQCHRSLYSVIILINNNLITITIIILTRGFLHHPLRRHL